MRIDLNVDFNKDKRVKGCPNVNCEMHKNKKQQDNKNDYCPKCGTKLVYVCKKCFKEIEDNGPSHTICSLCEAKEEEKKQKMADDLKNVGTVALSAGAGIVALASKAGKKVIDDNKSEIINTGAKFIENSINKVIKK